MVKGTADYVPHEEPRVSISGELSFPHAPEMPGEDAANYERLIAWLHKRVAHDVLGQMLGPTWIERTR